MSQWKIELPHHTIGEVHTALLALEGVPEEVKAYARSLVAAHAAKAGDDAVVTVEGEGGERDDRVGGGLVVTPSTKEDREHRIKAACEPESKPDQEPHDDGSIDMKERADVDSRQGA